MKDVVATHRVGWATERESRGPADAMCSSNTTFLAFGSWPEGEGSCGSWTKVCCPIPQVLDDELLRRVRPVDLGRRRVAPRSWMTERRRALPRRMRTAHCGLGNARACGRAGLGARGTSWPGPAPTAAGRVGLRRRRRVGVSAGRRTAAGGRGCLARWRGEMHYACAGLGGGARGGIETVNGGWERENI